MEYDEGERGYFRREKYVWLGHDWGAGPAFWDAEGCYVDLDRLPISATLRDRYARWFYWYERRHYPAFQPPGFDRENPPFPDLAEFAAEGLAIAEAMKRELPDWRIVVRDYFHKRDVEY